MWAGFLISILSLVSFFGCKAVHDSPESAIEATNGLTQAEVDQAITDVRSRYRENPTTVG